MQFTPESYEIRVNTRNLDRVWLQYKYYRDTLISIYTDKEIHKRFLASDLVVQLRSQLNGVNKMVVQHPTQLNDNTTRFSTGDRIDLQWC